MFICSNMAPVYTFLIREKYRLEIRRSVVQKMGRSLNGISTTCLVLSRLSKRVGQICRYLIWVAVLNRGLSVF